eukprot:8211053-Pyramimonas_sp.AAC.1
MREECDTIPTLGERITSDSEVHKKSSGALFYPTVLGQTLENRLGVCRVNSRQGLAQHTTVTDD